MGFTLAQSLKHIFHDTSQSKEYKPSSVVAFNQIFEGRPRQPNFPATDLFLDQCARGMRHNVAERISKKNPIPADAVALRRVQREKNLSNR